MSMKRSVYFVLIIQLMLNACSDDSSEVFDDAFLEKWELTVYDKDVSQSETYHLLDSLIDHMDKNSMWIFSFPTSNLNNKSVTVFNNYLWNNEEAVTFFESEDCVSVLISTYLTSLKTKTYLTRDDGSWQGDMWFHYLELVLLSDIFMSKMNVTEKIQLMNLALGRIKEYDYNRQRPCSIMISIMLSSNYSPFVNDAIIGESVTGAVYFLRTKNNDGRVMTEKQTADLLTRYAQQFINDNKK